MENLRGRASCIWSSIEENMDSLYFEINSKFENNPDDEAFNELNTIFNIISCSTASIQRVIENRLINRGEILNISEISEIIETIDAIKYYLNEKINEFKNSTMLEDEGKIIYYLILSKNVISSLYDSRNYLKTITYSLAMSR